MPAAKDAAAVPLFFAGSSFATLRTVPFAVFLVGAAAALGPAGFLTTEPALPSLVSLMPLALRPVLVAGLDAGALAAGPRRVWVAGAVLAEDELAFDAAVTLRAPPARVAFAFSTMLDRTFVAAEVDRPEPLDFSGEPGRDSGGLIGDAGRSMFFKREFDEVGDRIWAARPGTPPVAWPPRALFLGCSPC